MYQYRNKEFLGSFAISERFPGLPNDLDSSFQWSGNNRFYFTKGDQYYRINQSTRQWNNPESPLPVDRGYPAPLTVWWQYSSIQLSKVDSAIKYSNGRTYFFSGMNYYRFSDTYFRVSIQPLFYISSLSAMSL